MSKRLKIMAVGAVENDHILAEIDRQTVKPDVIYIYKDEKPATGINRRRRRIAENQAILQEAVKYEKPDYVWQVEGDSVLREDTLETLLGHAFQIDGLGYVSGVQVGRHGIYALGAWHFNSEEEFYSADYRDSGLKEVDATGFYCLLAPYRPFIEGKAYWNGQRWGPDVNYGLSLRERGYKIYCDMDLWVGHLTGGGIIYPDHISTCNVRFYKDKDWKYKCE